MNQTHYGIVFKCSKCNKVHIEFNNFNLNLSESDYRHFVKYINDLDGDYWAEKNRESICQRKIKIPIYPTAVCLMLHPNELSDLRQLLVLPEYVVEKQLTEKLLKTLFWN